MAYKLIYNERGKQRIFSTICPLSSRTVYKQNSPSDPPGLSVVSYIQHRDRAPFLKALRCLGNSKHVFRACHQLHITLLGLFAAERNQSFSDAELIAILEAVQTFFNRERGRPLSIKFDLIRPGIFEGQSESSDGTVVAMASEESEKDLLRLSHRLSEYLTREVPTLFSNDLRRPLPGVWCSLGFFDEPDFKIDRSVYDIFSRLTEFQASVQLETVAVTEFTFKSLIDGVVRTLIRL